MTSTAALTIALAALVPSPLPAAPGGKVPRSAWTTDNASAARVDAPIAEVTVFSDRARIRRRGRAPATEATEAGGKVDIQKVRFPSLPGAVYLDTIRVAVTGGRVLRVETAPIEREGPSIEEARRLLDQLDGVADRLSEIDDRRATDQWEVGFLRGLAPAPLVPEDKREGRKTPSADIASWWKALDFVGARARAAGGRLLQLEGERRVLIGERDRLLADQKALDRGSARRVVDVVAIVEVEAGRGAGAELELEYFVPGARWKPAYDLHFASARGQVRIETAAVVEQTTGEDWGDVVLLLSTATPGRGIDAPERLAWTLGEKHEFVPQPRRRVEETDHDSDGIPDQADRCPDVPEDHEGLQDDGCPEPDPDENGKKIARRLVAADEELERLRETIDSSRARLLDVPSHGGNPVSLPLPAPPRSSPGAEPALSDLYLPAVSGGGLDHVYRAPTAASVASANKQIRVPLVSQSFRVAAFHQAAPALTATAFLRGRVRNDGKRPLLRGPATIFGDGELVGVGEIQTTGPGGDIELPLGADPDVRLERRVVPRTQTTGLIIKSDETSYDVQIQIGNYKKQKVTIEVVDQLPRSGADKVEVKLLAAQPAAAGPDADGLMRWRVELAPGATQTLKLSYRITRPRGWQLSQE